MEVKRQDGEVETPALGYNQQPNTGSSSTVGERRTDPQAFRHGNAILNSPAQNLDQNHLPLQYSFRPRRDHPDQNPDPASAPATAPPPTTAASSAATPAAFSVRYRECLKNHAAKNGGHILDGCGEFMPSGEDGTPESYKCAACECHRNFHRREPEAEPPYSLTYYYSYRNIPNNHNSRRSISDTVAPSAAPPASSHFNHHNHQYSPSLPVGPLGPMMMAFGGSGGAPAESSSEDQDMYHQSNVGAEASGQRKKRFRTKFSQEQKMKMMEFADKLGWKIQKQDEQEVQQFCSQVGVKRRVFKVWMHNNKQQQAANKNT